MYSIYRGIALTISTIAAGFALTGAALALEIDIGIDQMEFMELVLNFLGVLFLFVCGVVTLFVRWWLKITDPSRLDPVTQLMFERWMKPLMDRLAQIEQTQKQMGDYLGEKAGKEETGRPWEAL